MHELHFWLQDRDCARDLSEYHLLFSRESLGAIKRYLLFRLKYGFLRLLNRLGVIETPSGEVMRFRHFRWFTGSNAVWRRNPGLLDGLGWIATWRKDWNHYQRDEWE